MNFLKYTLLVICIPNMVFAQVTGDNSKLISNKLHCPTINVVLSSGSTDRVTFGQVTALQNFLKAYYGLNDQKFVVSGKYGALSKNLVKRFQKDNFLPVSGIVGKLTSRTIMNNCNVNADPVQNFFFKADKYSVQSGMPVLLSWNATFMCSILQDNSILLQDHLSGSAYFMVYPKKSAQYTLSCSDPNFKRTLDIQVDDSTVSTNDKVIENLNLDKGLQVIGQNGLSIEVKVYNIKLPNSKYQPVELEWGDGYGGLNVPATVTGPVEEYRTVSHTYSEPGIYTILRERKTKDGDVVLNKYVANIINDEPSIFLISTNMDNSFKINDKYLFKWITKGDVTNYKVAFYLDNEEKCDGIKPACSKGLGVLNIPVVNGSIYVQIPNNASIMGDGHSVVLPGKYYLRITMYDPLKSGVAVAQHSIPIEIVD